VTPNHPAVVFLLPNTKKIWNLKTK
jgi:hypothetical protein